MQTRYYILSLLAVIVLNVGLLGTRCRRDLSSDHRYTISPTTREMLRGWHTEKTTFSVDNYLCGELNAGFSALSQSTADMLRELGQYVAIEVRQQDPTEMEAAEQRALHDLLERYGYHPIEIHESTGKGEKRQTIAYPYLRVSNGTRSTLVALVDNNPMRTGQENLNSSEQSLEYNIVRAMAQLQSPKRSKVAFIEGHGELPELNTASLEFALSRYCDVYYGRLSSADNCLDEFDCIIVADPQTPFTDADKYIIDQYIMHGGRVLWLLSGVQMSEQVLSQQGFTPVIARDLRLQDMLFRYGVRVNNDLLQDVSCLPIRVDMSTDPTRHDYHPMPWTYAPLLSCSADSYISRGVTQVSAVFASTIDLVGEGEGQHRQILLTSSSTAKTTGTPAKVDLEDMTPLIETFNRSNLPVGVAIDGRFESLFAHRLTPREVESSRPTAKEGESRQVIIGSGSIARNETQSGRPLPLGFDRYTQMQFGNCDLLTNAVLYLTDSQNLLQLRQKDLQIRLLSKKSIKQSMTTIQTLSIALPLLVLLLTAMCFYIARKQIYSKPYNNRL